MAETVKSLFTKGTSLFIFFLFMTFTLTATSGKLAEKVNEDHFIEKNKLLQEIFFDIPPNEEWNKTFGGISEDWGYSLEQTTDGGYIIIGFTQSFGVGGYDMWLIKTDCYGKELWNKTYGGSNDDMGTSVLPDFDGGYIITGLTGSYGAGDYDVWLIKTDADGNEIWNKTFGGSYSDGGMCVQRTSDGGYIVAGLTISYGAGNYDVWLIKTDADGNELWNKTYGGSDSDGAYSIQQIIDGGYALIGRTESYGMGYPDGWLIRTDSSGNELWNKTFGGDDYDCLYSGQRTTDGGYVLTGNTISSGDSNVWLIKTDLAGNEEWNTTLGGSKEDVGYMVQQTTDGEYIVAGYTRSYGAGSYDGWLVKTDANGNELWNKTFGGTEDDRGYSFLQTIDDGYIIIGYTMSYGEGEKDVWLIKAADEPELKLTFFFGYVTNVSHFEGLIRFNAQNLFYLIFRPFSFGSYNSGEEIIAKQVIALTIEGNPGIVIGFYKISL